MVARGGKGVVRGCSGQACVVAPEGGRVWLLPGGGMRGIRRDTEIRSMSGRYASYWNAFLFSRLLSLGVNEPLNIT